MLATRQSISITITTVMHQTNPSPMITSMPLTMKFWISSTSPIAAKAGHRCAAAANSQRLRLKLVITRLRSEKINFCATRFIRFC